MKKIFLILATLFLFVTTLTNAQQVTFRQSAQEDLYIVNFSFTADSAASIFYSTTFTPPQDYNSDLYTTYPITVSYDLNTASGNPATIIALYGIGANGAVQVLDSLGIGTGAGDTLVSATANKCLLTLNAGYHFPAYKIGVTQIVGGKALTKSYVDVYFPRRKGR